MIPELTVNEKAKDWVGVDVSKKEFTAALAQEGQKWPATHLRDLPVKTFARTHEGLASFMEWLEGLTILVPRETIFGVAMESTGKYSEELATWMNEAWPRLRPSIINPEQTHAFIKSMNVRGRTDAIEARALAIYGLEREPVVFEPLSASQRALRELVRHRAHLLDLKLAVTNRQSEGSDNKQVCQSQARLRRDLDKEIAKAEKKMHSVIDKDVQMTTDSNILVSIYGVAFLTAAVVLAELGNLRRFARARQLSAFVGLGLAHKQSGSSIDTPAHFTKRGSGLVRKALYMAALTARQDKGDMQRKYEALIARGKPKMVAIGAIMRSLLVLMRRLLISGENYDPQWKACGKACG